MRSGRAEYSRVSRAVRWMLPTALLTLTPKCLLCLAGYAGLGAALGLGGPEMCGASAGSPGSWASSLTWLGGAAGLGVISWRVNYRRLRSAPTGRCDRGARVVRS